VVGAEEGRIALVKVLIDARVANFLAMIAAMGKVAADLAALHGWGADLNSGHSTSGGGGDDDDGLQSKKRNSNDSAAADSAAAIVLSSRSLLLSLVGRILSLGSTETFFACSHAQMQTLWSFLSADTHLLGTQSIDELAHGDGGGLGGAGRMGTESLGWALKLMVCAGNAVLHVRILVSCFSYFPSFFVVSSLSRSIAACLHSLTPHDTSLTIIFPSINQSINPHNTHITHYN
jgi:hypothetical protein